MDNYNSTYAVDEEISTEEQAEIDRFMDLVMATGVMTEATGFLKRKGRLTYGYEWCIPKKS